MTREKILKRLQELSDDRFAKLAPFLEADLEAADLEDLRAEIAAGRESAKTQPLIHEDEAYERARRALRK